MFVKVSGGIVNIWHMLDKQSVPVPKYGKCNHRVQTSDMKLARDQKTQMLNVKWWVDLRYRYIYIYICIYPMDVEHPVFARSRILRYRWQIWPQNM